MMLPAAHEQELTSMGDCLLHYHSYDRVPTHDTVNGLQNVTNITSVTGNITLNQTHDIILADSTSGNIVITLPLASGGKEFEIVKTVMANTVQVLPTGSDTVVGTTDVMMYVQWTALRFKSVSGGYILL